MEKIDGDGDGDGLMGEGKLIKEGDVMAIVEVEGDQNMANPIEGLVLPMTLMPHKFRHYIS